MALPVADAGGAAREARGPGSSGDCDRSPPSDRDLSIDCNGVALHFGADTAPTVRYTYANVIVAQTRDASGTPTTSFYGYDAHGNISFLTGSTGAETDSYVYDAWGTYSRVLGRRPIHGGLLGRKAAPTRTT
jgi:hypothetical protein